MSSTPPPPDLPEAPEPPRRTGLPSGPALWLSGGAFLIALAALVVAIAGSGDSSEPEVTAGATTAGPNATWSVRPGTLPDDPAEPDPVVTDGASTGSASPAPSGQVDCPPASVTAFDAPSLEEALAQAGPGDSIRLADGTYTGRFTAKTPGLAENPVFLCGGPGAVVDGGGTDGGYALHLDGASYWRLVGFTVRNGQKGVMADRVRGTVIQGLTVERIGDEAIHLRNFSSDNMVRDNTIRTTGLRKEKFGEGVYIGSAESNWCTVSQCKPDASDRNAVVGNRISDTTAEAVDIKEGTTGGRITGNSFDGSKLDGSHNDSWVDVKGNGWLIQGNTGRHSPEDGFQTHEILKGWGSGNTFKGNTAQVDGPGWGFHLTSDGNEVACDNKVTGAAKGLANAACTP
ncbi:right-handed parallel beta-helix repeat-containing protein [Streptomyces sp. GMY02]|uniref:right-handed parallel beta-helix repeat-containing protein n=1 Tax=Streptomyces sp. GMY02 TaxID=1333528 RepID=UPI001C2BEDE8|nr:right-handed parallel beta-helix repeat-containing protein [Streptomyces sp. GMY02]QXE35408.1 right-handed parallel beta-helix repeat-containing protein [Streptomyces sp. GMY02]